MKTLLAVAMVMAGLSAEAGAEQTVGTTSVLGVRENGSTRTLLHIHLALPEGSDADTVTREALKAEDAQPVRPEELQGWGFELQGAQWAQFSTNGRNDDEVAQYYSPVGAPIPGIETVLLKTQTTWNDVRSSRFRFEFGGITTRTVTESDGFNDVGWRAMKGTVIGITLQTFNIITGAFIEADVWLNSTYPWTTNPPPPPPPGSKPPRGSLPLFRFDVETILLHEEGHVLGLAHINDRAAVMYPYYAGVVRELSDGDVAGVTTLYPRQPLRPVRRRDPSVAFRRVATVGEWIPTRMARWIAFEPGGLNDRGDVSFSADLFDSCDPGPCVEAHGQGVFLAGGGPIRQIARTAQQAPGSAPGRGLDVGVIGPSALNAQSDVGFAFSQLSFLDVWQPWGMGVGIYRYDAQRNDVAPLVIPWSTPLDKCAPPVFSDEPPCSFEGGHHADINDRGDVAFAATPSRWWPVDGLDGVFVADRTDGIRSIVVPGDPAPENRTFDNASAPSINNVGDVAFDAHVGGAACAWQIGLRCLSGVYVRRGLSGPVEAIAAPGDAAPGGGTIFFAAGPEMNNRGDVLFAASLGHTERTYGALGLFLSSNGKLMSVVRPGDEMPGGGRLRTASLANTAGPVYSLSDNGLVAFNATLDTDEDDDGIFDTGVYVWVRGKVTLVARSGTAISGTEQIAFVQDYRLLGARQSLAGAIVNNRGQVLFQAILTDGTGVLLVAEPKHAGTLP